MKYASIHNGSGGGWGGEWERASNGMLNVEKQRSVS